MSLTRMSDLMEDEDFKKKLLSLYKSGQLKAGEPCPSECGDVLKWKHVNYTDSSSEPWTVREVTLVACSCGFQFKVKEEAEA